MKSEDIARYVAGLEEALDRADRRLVNVEAEVQQLRAVLPALPDVGPVTVRGDGYVVDEWWMHGDYTAEQRRANAKSLLRDASRYLAVAAFQDAEAAAADTTPDTSRVTFGARHEGTGMVLLQHADLPSAVWGAEDDADLEFHRDGPHGSSPTNRAAHAALAEVREALDTAEAAGVDVRLHGAVLAGGAIPAPDAGEGIIGLSLRARRYLAREVQALVDQGLRGDDLNTRVPYEVRDHRTPVEVDTTPDDEDPLDKPVRHYLDMLSPGTSVEFGGDRPWKLRAEGGAA